MCGSSNVNGSSNNVHNSGRVRRGSVSGSLVDRGNAPGLRTGLRRSYSMAGMQSGNQGAVSKNIRGPRKFESERNLLVQAGGSARNLHGSVRQLQYEDAYCDENIVSQAAKKKRTDSATLRVVRIKAGGDVVSSDIRKNLPLLTAGEDPANKFEVKPKVWRWLVTEGIVKAVAKRHAAHQLLDKQGSSEEMMGGASAEKAVVGTTSARTNKAVREETSEKRGVKDLLCVLKNQFKFGARLSDGAIKYMTLAAEGAMYGDGALLPYGQNGHLPFAMEDGPYLMREAVGMTSAHKGDKMTSPFYEQLDNGKVQDNNPARCLLTEEQQAFLSNRRESFIKLCGPNGPIVAALTMLCFSVLAFKEDRITANQNDTDLNKSLDVDQLTYTCRESMDLLVHKLQIGSCAPNASFHSVMYSFLFPNGEQTKRASKTDKGKSRNRAEEVGRNERVASVVALVQAYVEVHTVPAGKRAYSFGEGVGQYVIPTGGVNTPPSGLSGLSARPMFCKGKQSTSHQTPLIITDTHFLQSKNNEGVPFVRILGEKKDGPAFTRCFTREQLMIFALDIMVRCQKGAGAGKFISTYMWQQRIEALANMVNVSDRQQILDNPGDIAGGLFVSEVDADIVEVLVDSCCDDRDGVTFLHKSIFLEYVTMIVGASVAKDIIQHYENNVGEAQVTSECSRANMIKIDSAQNVKEWLNTIIRMQAMSREMIQQDANQMDLSAIYELCAVADGLIEYDRHSTAPQQQIEVQVENLTNSIRATQRAKMGFPISVSLMGQMKSAGWEDTINMIRSKNKQLSMYEMQEAADSQRAQKVSGVEDRTRCISAYVKGSLPDEIIEVIVPRLIVDLHELSIGGIMRLRRDMEAADTYVTQTSEQQAAGLPQVVGAEKELRQAESELADIVHGIKQKSMQQKQVELEERRRRGFKLLQGVLKKSHVPQDVIDNLGSNWLLSVHVDAIEQEETGSSILHKGASAGQLESINISGDGARQLQGESIVSGNSDHERLHAATGGADDLAERKALDIDINKQHTDFEKEVYALATEKSGVSIGQMLAFCEQNSHVFSMFSQKELKVSMGMLHVVACNNTYDNNAAKSTENQEDVYGLDVDMQRAQDRILHLEKVMLGKDEARRAAQKSSITADHFRHAREREIGQMRVVVQESENTVRASETNKQQANELARIAVIEKDEMLVAKNLAEREKADMCAVKDEAVTEKDIMRNARDEALVLRDTMVNQANVAVKERDVLRNCVQEIKEEKEIAIHTLEEEKDGVIQALKEEKEIAIHTLEEEKDGVIQALKEEKEIAIHTLEEEKDGVIQALKEEKDKVLQAKTQDNADRVQDMQDKHEIAIEKVRVQAETKLQGVSISYDEKIEEAKKYTAEVTRDIDNLQREAKEKNANIEQMQGAMREVTQEKQEAKGQLEVLRKHMADLSDRLGIRDVSLVEDMNRIGEGMLQIQQGSLEQEVQALALQDEHRKMSRAKEDEIAKERRQQLSLTQQEIEHQRQNLAQQQAAVIALGNVEQTDAAGE